MKQFYENESYCFYTQTVVLDCVMYILLTKLHLAVHLLFPQLPITRIRCYPTFLDTSYLSANLLTRNALATSDTLNACFIITVVRQLKRI